MASYFAGEMEYAEADVKAAKEAYAMFNKTPKYNVNDIVIIDKGFSFECGHNVVGVIKDVFNHRDTGDVFYHIIFNSGTPRKVFEEEIEAKFNKDRFKDGQSIHKQLLAKMYHTNRYKCLSENEVIAWAYDANLIDVDDAIKANYTIEEIKKMINNTFDVPEFAKRKKFKFTEMFEGEIKGLVSYKKIIFNGPCTIILWKDGTKTIAKTSGGDIFDPEKGVAICFMKKALGHTETNKVLRKASKDFYDEIARVANIQLDEEIKKSTFPLPKGITFRPFIFGAPMDNNKVIKVAKGDQDESK